jgi:hypothetical protein
VIDLNDRRFADLLVGVVDRVVEQKLRTMLRTHHYGTVVGAPDTVKRTVAVALLGKPEPSPGFVYGEIVPVEGDVVRVIIDPKGDRYVDAIMGRDALATGPETPLVIDVPTGGESAIEIYTAGVLAAVFGGDGALYWGGDTTLRRDAAATLRTDTRFEAGVLASDGLVEASLTALSGDTTPTVSGGGTATYTSRNCRWIRIGRLVVFSLQFVVNAAGSGATTVTVTGTGLPEAVTSFGVAGDRQGVAVTRVAARMLNSGGELTVSQIHNLNGFSAIDGATLASGAGYNLAGAYITT